MEANTRDVVWLYSNVSSLAETDDVSNTVRSTVDVIELLRETRALHHTPLLAGQLVHVPLHAPVKHPNHKRMENGPFFESGYVTIPFPSSLSNSAIYSKRDSQR